MYASGSSPSTPRDPRHRVANSLDTLVSGMAESTMSLDTLQLADFPRPPLTIPESPASLEFTSYSRERPSFNHFPTMASIPPSPPPPPLYGPRDRNRPRPLVVPPSDSHFSHNPYSCPRPPPPQAAATAATPSPFDWNEGSSTIDVGLTEERLFSTSFITSLLSSSQHSSPTSPQFPAASARDDRPSSDAVSGISDLIRPLFPPPYTYPPQLPPGTAYCDQDHISPALNRTRGDYNIIPSYAQHDRPAINIPSTSRIGAGTISVEHIAPSLASMSQSDGPSVRSAQPLTQELQMNVGVQSSRSTPVSTPTTMSPFKRRQSTQSSKTTGSFVSSIISRFSRGPSRSKKHQSPPPVPPIPDTSLSQVIEVEKQVEELHSLRRHQQLNDVGTGKVEIIPDSAYSEAASNQAIIGKNDPNPGFIYRWTRIDVDKKFLPAVNDSDQNIVPSNPKKKSFFAFLRTGKRRIILFATLVVVIIIMSIVIGVVVGKKTANLLPSCPGNNTTGVACDLNSTCVCPSSSSDICIAQNLVTLTPTVNQLFDCNFTIHSIASALFFTRNAPVNGNCAYQAMLVDVGASLLSSTSPNRTTWAQSALLWQLVQSLNLSSVTQLRTFVNQADFTPLGGDGPGRSTSSSSTYNITSLGFNFDFAAQTVTPLAASWEIVGQPSMAQLNEVNAVSSVALDRMYSYAVASSTQQQESLSTYWQITLGQDPGNLDRFLSIISGSPIVIPFDTTFSSGGQTVVSLLTNSTTQFPPPIACYPALSADQLALINGVEGGIFGLSLVSSPSQFGLSCYGDHPIYGILDVMRLRLPFVDSRTDVAKQGAVLQRAVSHRAVLHSSEILSVLPHTPNNSTTRILDPKQFGTLNNFNHVILQYLSSISDINVATAFVQFVLSSSDVPPSNTSTLFNSLSALPILEVAVFGNITYSDMDSFVSSFSTPSGTLWFGSDACASLRNWAIGVGSSSIVWTDSAAAPEVVRESSLVDPVFNEVWKPAYQYFHTPNPGVTVTVSNITSSFMSLGKFGP